MNWRYFIGACILTASVMLSFAPWKDVAAGIALAILISRVHQHRKGVPKP